MNKDNRKELIRAYKEKSPDAGVYRFISTKSGKSLIDNTMDLKGIANKLAFGVKIGAGNMLPPEMAKEAKEHGIDTIQFEILEKVDIKPEMTKEDIKEENDVLLSLWLEREDIWDLSLERSFLLKLYNKKIIAIKYTKCLHFLAKLMLY